MFHEIEDIEQERTRLSHQPSAEEAPPVLCAFDVRTSGSVAEFEERLRSVLTPALQLAVSHPFDGGDLPVDTLPDWFVAAARGASATVPEFVSRGTERYAAALGRRPWDLQEWLYQFDPESEFRGWAWWDLTQSGSNTARIWVDTWGESFFACDELRWAAYVSGSDEVTGPILVRVADWVSAITA
ncbi:hypothetical protein ACOT81_33480 [Streptomyces sp. WI04-05B]|uniref:hypothetical protein n=1 Tax=Streptomyces TaxID=1883 RepID=UPI0029B6CA6F|nr:MULTISPECIES: hypothetical protein [unclassified Streptomyces]MDX2541775.1 hypothetical protein [Streptomyces sp. WI04-05B]MDX2586857.1 hypothetical protein [Streptomyces sp. WI04-05A]MDX3749819.1 hypothetical protein [Streptomyces sp. AK08-02]